MIDKETENLQRIQNLEFDTLDVRNNLVCQALRKASLTQFRLSLFLEFFDEI